MLHGANGPFRSRDGRRRPACSSLCQVRTRRRLTLLGLTIANLSPADAVQQALPFDRRSSPALDQTLDAVAYTGVAEALAERDTQVLLFGKPNARPNRRMGVALAAGADVAEARARADRAAGKITVVAAS